MEDCLEKRIEKMHQYHRRGYNCAQSLVCAFCDKVELDEKTLFKIAEGFGLGMGGMNGVCGAVSAGIILNGLKTSTGNLEQPDSKKNTQGLSKIMTNEFMEKHGSIVCRELKGLDNKEGFTSCDQCMEDMANIIEKYL